MPSEYPHNVCVCVYSGKKKHLHTQNFKFNLLYLPRLPCNSNVAMGTGFQISRSHMTGSTFLDVFCMYYVCMYVCFLYVLWVDSKHTKVKANLKSYMP